MNNGSLSSSVGNISGRFYIWANNFHIFRLELFYPQVKALTQPDWAIPYCLQKHRKQLAKIS